MITQTQSKRYTAEEYLALEVDAEERHEFLDGEIISMTGGTPNHNEIASNFLVILKLALKSQPFRTFITDQRVWIPQMNQFTYPDLIVVPQPLEFQSGRKDTLTNPLLIAEVLSQGTRNYDKDLKFAAYRTIPSFREYILIDQYAVNVEHYAKTNEQEWIFREYKHLADRVVLSTLPVAFNLTDLYENIQFES